MLEPAISRRIRRRCQGYISEIAEGEASTHGKLDPERQQVYYGSTAGTDETIAYKDDGAGDLETLEYLEPKQIQATAASGRGAAGGNSGTANACSNRRRTGRRQGGLMSGRALVGNSGVTAHMLAAICCALGLYCVFFCTLGCRQESAGQSEEREERRVEVADGEDVVFAELGASGSVTPRDHEGTLREVLHDLARKNIDRLGLCALELRLVGGSEASARGVVEAIDAAKASFIHSVTVQCGEGGPLLELPPTSSSYFPKDVLLLQLEVWIWDDAGPGSPNLRMRFGHSERHHFIGVRNVADELLHFSRRLRDPESVEARLYINGEVVLADLCGVVARLQQAGVVIVDIDSYVR